MLQELNQSGITIFLTTHNMEEANQLCNRVAIINNGMIIALDRPEKLRAFSKKLQSVEVAFDKPVDSGSLKLPGVVQVKEMGDRVRLYTEDSNSLLLRMVEYAKANGLKFVTLNFLAPSLEDVFLTLTNPQEV
jgi:ABC-2 type transport system ATP-binding protein